MVVAGAVEIFSQEVRLKMTVDLANSDKLLTTTRAVRKRIDFDRPVERSLIEQSVEVALQAPNFFPVSFIAVTDADRRKQMGDLYCEAHLPYLKDSVAQATANMEAKEAAQFTRHYDMIAWATENMHRVPVHVHVAGQGLKSLVGFEASFYGCILPPAWSFMLALRARGIGSSWTTIHIQEQYKDRMKAMLELPDDASLGVFLPCGYYTGEDFKPAKRPTVADSLHWEKW